jgi:hypothetical protein
LHQELDAKHSKLIEWSHLRVVNLNLARGSTIPEVVNYLETIPTTKESAVLKEKLADLYATQGKPSSAVTYEQALKLDPHRSSASGCGWAKTPALNREADAYANYQKFVEESPDYVDKLPYTESRRWRKS